MGYIMNAFFNPQPKEEFWRSKKYQDFISRRPCARCGKMNPDGLNDPHHERALGGGGTAIKPSDVYLVPLSHDCHVIRDGWKGPVFYDAIDALIDGFGVCVEETFYPNWLDIKMLIIKQLNDFLMEKTNVR
jgi:hypothetical protein